VVKDAGLKREYSKLDGAAAKTKIKIQMRKFTRQIKAINLY
jgi:hypothetical protein